MLYRKIYGYTLIELALTLTLTGILVLLFLGLMPHYAPHNQQKLYLSYFLTLDALLQQADSVYWDGNILKIAKKNNGPTYSFSHPAQNTLQDRNCTILSCLKIVSRPEPHEAHTLKFLYPKVASVEWSFWDKTGQKWQQLQPNFPYKKKIFRVILRNKKHQILEQFVLQMDI